MSADLCWAIVRSNHAYLLKKRTVKKPFSLEPNNLKSVHSQKYNGFCRREVVGIDPARQGKGLILTYKSKRNQTRPSKCYKKTVIHSGPRRALTSVRNFMNKNLYRRDLRMAALRKASAILKSQRAQPFKKVRKGQIFGRYAKVKAIRRDRRLKNAKQKEKKEALKKKRAVEQRKALTEERKKAGIAPKKTVKKVTGKKESVKKLTKSKAAAKKLLKDSKKATVAKGSAKVSSLKRAAHKKETAKDTKKPAPKKVILQTVPSKKPTTVSTKSPVKGETKK